MMLSKQEIREQIWDRLEREKLARFPWPVKGRIPNFVGAEKAAELLRRLSEFESAGTVKVNPDSPQLKVRELVLRNGKQLLMPAPRLRSGFVLVNPRRARGRERFAASIKGAFSLGEAVSMNELPRPDLLVVGSVAVSRDGSRIGKGEGYSEIEYGILRELGLVKGGVPIFTTVHPVQIVEKLPQDPFDVAVDRIITPDECITVKERRERPQGIFWDRVDDEMFEEMPILRELREKRG